jgi:carbonic anhydrase
VPEYERMLAANEEWARDFQGGLPVAPARKVAVVACMDSRMPLFPLLGLAVGDAHVIRNAGGVVTEDTIRSLTISQHVLGTREIVLVHHTDCGLQKTDDASFADLVEQATGARPPWPARTFTDADEDVRESIRLLRESPYLLSKDVCGTVYDVETGLLHRVDPDAGA